MHCTVAIGVENADVNAVGPAFTVEDLMAFGGAAEHQLATVVEDVPSSW